MPTTWRQGDIVAPKHAVVLRLLTTEQQDTQRFVVASHSCDIANSSDVEPDVEMLLATVVAEQQADFRNGHRIRELHVPANGTDGTEWLELNISRRRSVRKLDLLAEEPWSERAIPANERSILRRWLAQRYSRSEFPTAFISWLRDSGVSSRFERLGKRCSGSLVGIYFDLDDDSERDDPDNPYALGIHLVYSTADTSHTGAAEKAAAKLEAIFRERCHRDGRWRWIELLYCDAIADEVFTLRAANTFRRWRFEHRSVSGEPIDDAEG